MTHKKSALPNTVLTTTGSLLLAGVASLYANPEELNETTVLATGYSTELDTTGLQVHVQSAESLNTSGIWRLNEAVLRSPGVNLFSNGANGSATSIFTRGTESDHTALFVDGIKITHSRVFPFPAGNILSGASIQSGEKIELLRGPQSALYGSDSIGGVLSLSLEKGKENGQNRAWFELGSFETLNGGLSFQGQEEDLSYNAVFSWQQTANDRNDNDHESFHSALRLDYAISDNTNIGATLRILNFQTEVPALGFTPFAINETENTIGSFYIESQLTDQWFSKFTIGAYSSDFENIGGFGDSIVETSYTSLEWQNRFAWNNENTTTLGLSSTLLDTLNSGADIPEESERNQSIYLQHTWNREDVFNLTTGIRHDDYDDGEDSTTFRISGQYQASEKINLHASVASAFRRPSVIDLFGFFGFGGNADLDSEESIGWDAGITWDISETSNIDITYFQNDIDDLIAFENFSAQNIAEARTYGIEASYQASYYNDTLSTKLAYTWLEAENLSDNNRLLRRPRHTLSADIQLHANDQLTLGTGVYWVADREDVDALTFTRIDAEDYVTARIYGSYQITDSITFNGRIENLFDEDYSEVDGFPARGIGAFAGLSYTW